MMIAMPIAFACILLLAYPLQLQQYMAVSSAHAAGMLRLYDYSQAMLDMLDGSMGYAAYSSALQNLSAGLGINASIKSIDAECGKGCACRIATISGHAYVLMVCGRARG